MAERTRGNKAAGKKRKEARKKPKRSRKEAKKKPKSEKGDCTVGWFQYTAAVRAEVSGSPSEAVGWQDGAAGSHHEAPDHWGLPKLLQIVGKRTETKAYIATAYLVMTHINTAL